MRRRLVLLLLAAPAVAACGSTTTKTVIKTTTAPVASASTSSTTISSSATPTATSTTTSTTITATSTAAPAAAVFFRGAAGPTQPRPPALQLTADGTLAVEHVQWASWGGATATGTGNAFYHGCTPNCASAPTHTALVAIRLFGVRSCSGRNYYSGVTLTLNSGQLLDRSFLQQSWAPC